MLADLQTYPVMSACLNAGERQLRLASRTCPGEHMKHTGNLLCTLGMMHAWRRACGHLALTLMNSSKAMRLSLLESTFSITLRISALLTLRPSPSVSPARLFSSTSISRESRLSLPLLSTCTRSGLFRVCLSSLQTALLCWIMGGHAPAMFLPICALLTGPCESPSKLLHTSQSTHVVAPLNAGTHTACLAMQQDQSGEAGGVGNLHRIRQRVQTTHTG